MASRASRGRGLWLDVDDLKPFIDAMEGGQKALPEVFREVLAGEGGEAIRNEMRSNTPRRTSATANSIKIRRLPAMGFRGIPGVEVGVGDGNHPKSGLPLRSVGSILESGAAEHVINPKARRGNDRTKRAGLRLPSGRWVSTVTHPGVKARRPAARGLRTAGWEVTAAIFDALKRRQWAREGAI